MKALVTGSSGLVGSETVKFLAGKNWQVIGIDNNMREYFFGKEASTDAKRVDLYREYKTFFPLQADIRNYEEIKRIFHYYGPFDFIIHAAAQPAHDWSVDHTLEDFQVNAVGTMNMLEAYRQYSPKAPFIHVSTSKVYGDHVNRLPLIEYKQRYDLPKDHPWYEGTDESMQLQNSLHSPFGASKLSGDVMAQEFALYFNLPISIFRPVCITGPSHMGAKLHGYLAYLVKCIATGQEYTINGYMGKQVRDNIHSFDLVSAFWEVFLNPKIGEIYNIGAGRQSNNSMQEAVGQTEKLLRKRAKIIYSDENRRGDHKWCIFSANKFKSYYPNWKITYTNDKIMKELCDLYL